MAFPHGVDNYWRWWYNHVMARPPRNALAIQDFSRNMAKVTRHNAATPKDIELWAYATLGFRVGQESIRKALNGEIDPTQCAVELLLVLAEFYGVEPQRLGKFADERIRPIMALSSIHGPKNKPSGRRSVSSGWLRESAA